MPDKRKIVYVHAGRHKTGTSAIQIFMSQNRERFEAAGYRYPRAGQLKNEHAHHALALALTPHNKAFPPEVAHRILRNFKREIGGVDAITVVSSEQFQNIPPHRLAAYLQDRQVHPVIYLRDHLHYLVSSYQQAVQARTLTLSLAEFHEQNFMIVYADMLDRWRDAFGAGNLMVRIYDKAAIRNGNVVEDFVWNLTGREAAEFGEVAKIDVNPSLGEPLLAFKRAINAYLDNEIEQRNMLYVPFSRLAAQRAEWRSKPSLPRDLVERVRERARPDAERLRDDYLPADSPRFTLDWPCIVETVAWRYDPQAIMAELAIVSPRAADYLRAKVPACVLEA